MVFSLNGIEFTLVEIVIWLIVATICGSIAAILVGYRAGGLFAAMGIGLIGAVLGSWIARALALPALLVLTFGGTSIELVWTIIGAALLVLLLSLIRRPPRRKTYRSYR